jgi:RimJ/RimL family protein N-acetyltransferase
VDFEPVPQPGRDVLRGGYVLLRPLEAERDSESLYAVSHPPEGDPGIWTYLPYGPYPNANAMRDALLRKQASQDPLFFTVVPLETERASGVASYLRIGREFGVIEIGHIWFGTPLQRTAAGTEAIYLLARHAFDDLGYRRLEWKCNALNATSRRAAERFGFSFEGVFRKHMVVKGRNRDSAWYAIVDDEWPAVRAGFERWLDPANFDPDGAQRRSLAELRLRP